MPHRCSIEVPRPQARERDLWLLRPKRDLKPSRPRLAAF